MTTAAEVPATDTVAVKIDGRTVHVRKGTNVLEAAKQIGIDIPFFCYHPGLSSPAVCRQCLVEVAGQPKLVPSCYTPVADKMEVQTASEKVLLARRQMLEFTLVNHPVDCPICDKAGECTLQRLYFDWDSKASRVDLLKVHKPKVVDLGPTIVLDQERCILCTRCIRVCDEVAHEHQLEMANRGDREVLTTAPGTALDNPYSLNTVDVCPVGALTSKDFRFAMRAWELKMVPSVCTGCATGCNDEIHFAAGKIWRLVPRENQAVNKFWMCDEGRFTYKEILTKRRVAPTVGGERVSLERALQGAAARLQTALAGDRSRIGVVLSAQFSNEDNWAMRRMADGLGVTKRYLGMRPPAPERADDVLRHADVNPNTRGALACDDSLGDSEALTRDLEAKALSALIILGEDLVLPDAVRARLPQLDGVVLLACHDGALTQLAHVVLPAAAWAEVHATITNAKGMVQRLRAALEPPGEARPAWQLVARLSTTLGHALEWSTPQALFTEMVEAVPHFAGATWGREAPPVQLRFAGSRG